MGDIKITDLYMIHELDDVKDKFQVFDTKEGRVLQSMVLTRDELMKLDDEIDKIIIRKATKE